MMVNQGISQKISQKYRSQIKSLDLQGCNKNMWEQILEYRGDWVSKKKNKNDQIRSQKIFNWEHLRYLVLNDCGINGLSLKQCVFKPWPNIQRLQLSKNIIGSIGAKLLIKSDLPSLKYLFLEQSFINNEGAKTLSKSIWPKLKTIWLKKNKIRFDGLCFLIFNNWKQLKIINLQKEHNTQAFGKYIMILGVWQKMKIQVKLSNQMLEQEVNRILEKWALPL